MLKQEDAWDLNRLAYEVGQRVRAMDYLRRNKPCGYQKDMEEHNCKIEDCVATMYEITSNSD